MNVFQIVTDRIIKQLESGTVPWRRGWATSGKSNGMAVNWKTGKEYNGINRFLLVGGEYATFKQITDAGGKVKKGANSEIVVFWKWFEKAGDDGKIQKIPVLRYYNVFEINSQVEGLSSKFESAKAEKIINPIQKCEEIVNGYMGKPDIIHTGNEAYYSPFFDHVVMPNMNKFHDSENYYSVLFHELAHSTGHKNRLARLDTNVDQKFGSPTYAKEELVAEMTATFLCSIANIENTTIDNSAAYIASWLKALKNDNRLVVFAASQAEKATKYILGDTLNESSDEE